MPIRGFLLNLLSWVTRVQVKTHNEFYFRLTEVSFLSMFKTEMIFKTFSIGDIEIDFIVSFMLVLFPKFNPLSQKKGAT